LQWHLIISCYCVNLSCFFMFSHWQTYHWSVLSIQISHLQWTLDLFIKKFNFSYLFYFSH
jgi:hypothetical protein